MRLRSGKEYKKLFCPKEAQPLKLILLPNKKKIYDVNIDFDEASKHLEEIILKTISIQMQSDVPLGALLSGGIDSSLVVAMMQKNSTNPINTFTIGFDNNNWNEAHHSKLVAKYLGTNHEELYLSNSEVLKAVKKLALMYDEPFADSSQIPTYLVSKLARSLIFFIATISKFIIIIYIIYIII